MSDEAELPPAAELLAEPEVPQAVGDGGEGASHESSRSEREPSPGKRPLLSRSEQRPKGEVRERTASAILDLEPQYSIDRAPSVTPKG